MKSLSLVRMQVTLGFFVCIFFAGCPAAKDRQTTDTTSQVDAAQSMYLLDDEPEGAISIDEFRKLLLKSIEPEDPADETVAEEVATTEAVAVVLVGRVGGTVTPKDDGDFPWSPGEASFVISDPSFDADAALGEHAHEHDDPDHDCPFCQKSKSDAAKLQAFVEVVDENGAVVQLDARQLFGIAEDEVVVVQGLGKLTVGTLMISAEKVYVRH